MESDSEDDLRLAFDVARALVESGRPLSEDLQRSVGSALGTCFALNAVEMVREIWRGRELPNMTFTQLFDSLTLSSSIYRATMVVELVVGLT